MFANLSLFLLIFANLSICLSSFANLSLCLLITVNLFSNIFHASHPSTERSPGCRRKIFPSLFQCKTKDNPIRLPGIQTYPVKSTYCIHPRKHQVSEGQKGQEKIPPHGRSATPYGCLQNKKPVERETKNNEMCSTYFFIRIRKFWSRCCCYYFPGLFLDMFIDTYARENMNTMVGGSFCSQILHNMYSEIAGVIIS